MSLYLDGVFQLMKKMASRTLYAPSVEAVFIKLNLLSDDFDE